MIFSAKKKASPWRGFYSRFQAFYFALAIKAANPEAHI
jgi:hypothetical protein